jgi:hypothetical protein
VNDDTLAWVMVYASILGIAHHPRQTENGGKPSMTPEQAATATDAAMAPFRERVKNGAFR